MKPPWKSIGLTDRCFFLLKDNCKDIPHRSQDNKDHQGQSREKEADCEMEQKGPAVRRLSDAV